MIMVVIIDVGINFWFGGDGGVASDLCGGDSNDGDSDGSDDDSVMLRCDSGDGEVGGW